MPQFNQVGGLSEMATDFIFNQTFRGKVQSGETYLDLSVKGREVNKLADIGLEQKAAMTTQSPLYAIGTAFSTTSGSIPVLFPTFVDNQLYDFVRRDTPLASGLIPRVANRGLFADIVKCTALPSGAAFKPELAALPSSSGTYSRVAVPMKFAYDRFDISGPAMVASQAWQSVLAIEQERHFRAMKELEETVIINGDTTSSTYTDAFNGLVATITTNTTNKSGAELVLGDLNTEIDKIINAKGHPNLAVTDYVTFSRLRDLLKDYVRINVSSGQNGLLGLDIGADELSFRGIRFIPDLFMPTSSNAKRILILDTQSVAGGPNVQMRVLQELVTEELAKTLDATSYMMKAYYTMIVLNEAWCAMIYGLP